MAYAGGMGGTGGNGAAQPWDFGCGVQTAGQAAVAVEVVAAANHGYQWQWR